MSSGRVYNHSGVHSANFDNIDPYSTVNIGGVGTVNIMGTIGKGTTVIKQGVGELNIVGTVEESVIFKIGGVGDVNFRKRPPQSVIDQIEKQGVGDILIPGGWKKEKDVDSDAEANRTIYSDFSIMNINGLIHVTQNGIKKIYKGNCAQQNGRQLFIDGKLVDDSDAIEIKEASKKESNSPTSSPQVELLASSFSNMFRGSNIVAMGIAPGAQVGQVSNVSVSAFEITRYGK